MSTTPDAETPLYSSHIFMFPFRFEYLDNNKKIEAFESLNLQTLLGDSWEEKRQLSRDKYHEYNQKNYFNNYAREIL